MHLVDSHAHLDFDALAGDLDGVLSRAREAEVKTILSIGIGDGPATMHRARDLAALHRGTTPRIFASAGIHPQETHLADGDALAKLRSLAHDPLVLAIGEIGLDYYHLTNPDIAIQQQAFVAQLDIARDVQKPILIHLRTSELATPEARARFGAADATADFFRLVEQHWAPHGIGGVMHCFSGTAADAQRALDLGFHLSFAGNVTYNRFPGIREAARARARRPHPRRNRRALPRAAALARPAKRTRNTRITAQPSSQTSVASRLPTSPPPPPPTSSACSGSQRIPYPEIQKHAGSAHSRKRN